MKLLTLEQISFQRILLNQRNGTRVKHRKGKEEVCYLFYIAFYIIYMHRRCLNLGLHENQAATAGNTGKIQYININLYFCLPWKSLKRQQPPFGWQCGIGWLNARPNTKTKLPPTPGRLGLDFLLVFPLEHRRCYTFLMRWVKTNLHRSIMLADFHYFVPFPYSKTHNSRLQPHHSQSYFLRFFVF